MKFIEFIKNAASQAKQGARRQNSASVARDRLQILISHEASQETDPDFVQKLQTELLEVISKYVKVDRENIRVQLERMGDQSVLELNVTLSDNKPIELSTAKEAENTTTEKKEKAEA